MTAILASRSTIEYKLGKGWWISVLEKKYYFCSYLREERVYIHIHSKSVVSLLAPELYI